MQVCGGYALSLFRYDELERLVCGLPHLDFEALKAAARYEAGYHATHPTIQAWAPALQQKGRHGVRDAPACLIWDPKH